MSSTILKIIKPNNALDKDIKKYEVTQTIINEVKKISHLTKPTSADFLQFVASLLENLVVKRDKIDKKELFINILRITFPQITSEEIDLACTIVQSLIDNKIIKKIPILKYAWHLSQEVLGIFFVKLIK
jgi:signal transduction histidine kinase